MIKISANSILLGRNRTDSLFSFAWSSPIWKLRKKLIVRLEKTGVSGMNSVFRSRIPVADGSGFFKMPLLKPLENKKPGGHFTIELIHESSERNPQRRSAFQSSPMVSASIVYRIRYR
jgi:hypothetical protein